MLRIGESLTKGIIGGVPDFERCFKTETIVLNSFPDKVICLSYIDYDTGWNWLKTLIGLRNRLNDTNNYQFVTVVFGLSENPLTLNKVEYKITNPTMIGLPSDAAIPEIDTSVQTADDFIICIDDSDGGTTNPPYKKYAEIYGSAISSDTDFSTPYLNSSIRVFLASPGDDQDSPGTDISLVSDKWHSTMTPSSPDPLFFRRIRMARLIFANTGGNNLTPGETVTIPLDTLGGIGTGNSVTLTNNGGIYEYTSNISSTGILAVFPENNATSSIQVPIEIEYAETPPIGFDVPGNYAPSAASSAGVTVSLSTEEFSGSDFAVAERYLLSRMNRLATNPVLLYAEPRNGSTIATLGTVILQFSKPLDEGNTTDSELLQISGGGNSSLVYTPGFPNNPDKYRNTLTLTHSSGSLTNANASNEVTLSLGNTDSNHHLVDKAGNFLTGNRIVEYNADVTAPTITAITSDTANGTYTTGEAIDIDVTFSEDVILTGGELIVEVDADGGNNSIALTQSGSNPAFFSGIYTVSEGDSSNNLTVTVITLNPVTATLEDNVGHSANLALPGSENLADNSDIIIDTSISSPDKQHISFILDYSGSMDNPVVFGGDSKSKKEWVKIGVRDFIVDLLGSVSEDYSAGIVLYSSGVLTPLDLTDKAGLNSGTVDNALAQNPAQDLTAMGKGLAQGLKMLSANIADNDFNGRRAVILLADGQQNVPPYVITNKNDASHSGMDSLSLNTSIPELGTITLDYQQGLKIHTIGIGRSEGWLLDMANISTATGGEYCADEDAWPLVAEQCTNLLPELFPVNSPQIVRNFPVNLSAGSENIYSFPLNNSVRKLIVAIYWTGQKEYQCLLKCGNLNVPFTKIKESGNFFIGEVNFPAWGIPSIIPGLIEYGFKTSKKTDSLKNICYSKPFIRKDNKSVLPGKYPINRMIHAKGDWRVAIVEGKNHLPVESPSSVLFSVIADEKDIKYSLKTSPPNIATGNIYKYQFNLKSKSGIPIGKSMLKTAFQKPESNISLWHKVKTPFLRRLFRKKLPMVTLADQFKETATPGVYKTANSIRCDMGKEGIYERMVTRYFNVVAVPDKNMSHIKILSRDDRYLIEVKPKDKFGNLLGAGYEAVFQSKLQESAGFKISDMGNGTYEIIIPKRAVKNRDRIPDLIFKVFDKILD